MHAKQHPKYVSTVVPTKHWIFLRCLLLTSFKHGSRNLLIQGQVVRCCIHQFELHAEFNLKFQCSKGNLLVPSLHSVCRASHRVAAAAHSLGDKSRLNQAASLLQDSYSKTSNDRSKIAQASPVGQYDFTGSKKVGTLGVVNELFCIYFALNTLRLCTNLIKPVEAKKLHMQGTSSEMVTYRYYAGRLSLFEDNFGSAEQYLEYAFQHCHKDAMGNKRRILRYLIPVKLFRGRLPSTERKYEDCCLLYYID